MNSTADQLIEAVAAARLALEEAAANHTEANSRAATLLARVGNGASNAATSCGERPLRVPAATIRPTGKTGL